MRTLRRSVLVLTSGLMVGCSSSGQPAPTQSPAPAPSSPQVATIVAAPSRVASLSSRREATIRVDNGDGMVAVAGALWVKTDDGRAVEIDPATNRVGKTIELDSVSDPSRYCQGIGSDGESVFACATGDRATSVVQTAPATGRILRRFAAAKVFDQLALPVTSRGVWVLTGDGSRVGVADPATGRFTTYPLGTRCQQLAARGDLVVATSQLTNTVVIVDGAHGKVLGRVPVTSPRIAALAHGDVWVDSDDGLTRIEPAHLRVRAVYPDLIATAGGDVVATPDAVWLRTAEGTVSRIDPDSGQLVERIRADRPLTAGSLAIAFNSVWLTSGDDGTVVRLRLAA